MAPLALLCQDFVRMKERTEENKVLCSSHDKYHCNTRALTFHTPAESIQNYSSYNQKKSHEKQFICIEHAVSSNRSV